MPRLCEKISFLFVKHKLNLKILLSSSLWEIKGTFLGIFLIVLFIDSRAFPLIRPYSCKKKKEKKRVTCTVTYTREPENNRDQHRVKRGFSANPKLNNYISQWEPKKVAQRANEIFKQKLRKLCRTWENASNEIDIGLRFASDWLRGWPGFLGQSNLTLDQKLLWLAVQHYIPFVI